jgi:hypothetical protein
MKVSLKLVDKGMEVEIHAENDLEIIALEAWSDKYFNGKEGAFLIVSRDMVAPNNACTRPAFGSDGLGDSRKSAGG